MYPKTDFVWKRQPVLVIAFIEYYIFRTNHVTRHQAISLSLSPPRSARHFSSTTSAELAMAPKSSSSYSSCTARASLVLVLLLTAVAAAHAAHTVPCENKCGVPVYVNGIFVDVNWKLLFKVDASIAVVFKDKTGKEYKGSWPCPGDVSAIVLVHKDVPLKVKVEAVIFSSKLLHTVLGLVLGGIKCVL